MAAQGPSTTVVADPSLVLGAFAAHLAGAGGLPEALELLAASLGLRTAVLRAGSGRLLATAGEVLHAVPAGPAPAAPTLELPVQGRGVAATLTVSGARPSQLPVLRAAAAVLALALAAAPEDLEDVDAAQDELADALHDGPVQSLVVARYAADAAVRGGDPALVRDAVQDALVALRRHMWQLRPRGAAGLAEALEQLSAQRVEAGGEPLAVRAEDGADLTGREAVLAYRLAQAVAPAQAVLRRDGGAVTVDLVGGTALDHAERWSRRAAGLGGGLTSSPGRLSLALPPTLHALTPDARTAP